VDIGLSLPCDLDALGRTITEVDAALSGVGPRHHRAVHHLDSSPVILCCESLVEPRTPPAEVGSETCAHRLYPIASTRCNRSRRTKSRSTINGLNGAIEPWSYSVLASLLPGLRDLRTPLATGYLWLVTLWLLVHEHLPTSAATASGPTKSLLQLADLVGKATVLAAFSFIAYLVGSILMLSLRPNFAAYVVDPENHMLGGFIGSTIIRVTHGALGTPSSGLTTSMYDQIRTFASSRLRENNVRLSTKHHADILRTRPSAATDDANTERHNKELLAGDYSGAIIKDLPLVAIQLQAKNRDFWDTYDRHNAESLFRFGIAQPLVFLVIVWAWQSTSWWLILLAVPGVLVVLGFRHSVSATATLVQAVVLKLVEPPVLEELREAVAREEAEQRLR
jgi:hypothetical protein